MQKHKRLSSKKNDTSWQTVAPWYNKLVGSEGHYYHEHVVLPNVLRLLHLSSNSKLLDLGCGQGILAHSMPKIEKYIGVDTSPALIAIAKDAINIPNYSFRVANATQPLLLQPTFTHVTVILSLQNMDNAMAVIKNAAEALETNGTLILVLNHPAFRIPRQSGWNIDEKTKQQYRWLNRYNSALKIPIQMNPGRNSHTVTWSFHHSLQDYTQMLFTNGFILTNLEEWSSDKESVGKAAKMENRARSEFPLFLCLVAQKK